jgi:hypothetical protein
MIVTFEESCRLIFLSSGELPSKFENFWTWTSLALLMSFLTERLLSGLSQWNLRKWNFLNDSYIWNSWNAKAVVLFQCFQVRLFETAFIDCTWKGIGRAHFMRNW